MRIYNRALTPLELQNDMASPIVTSVATGEPSPPRSTALHRAAPNPFNPSTRIGFRLSTGTGAILRIYDVGGRFVREFDIRRLPPGEHSITWDGTAESGARLATGVYLARLESPDGIHTIKLALIR